MELGEGEEMHRGALRQRRAEAADVLAETLLDMVLRPGLRGVDPTSIRGHELPRSCPASEGPKEPATGGSDLSKK